MNPDELQQAFEEAKATGNFGDAYEIEKQLKSAPVDFDAGVMASNLIPSARNMLVDMGTAIANPGDTGRAVAGLGKSVMDKVVRNWQQFAVGGKIDDTDGSEEAANAVGGYIKDRYGSIDAFQQTLMDDPVGVMVDFSGFGLSTKTPTVARIAAATEPVNVMANTSKLVKFLIPEDAAAKLYQSAAKFSIAQKPGKRQAQVKTALDKGIMPTQKGANKLQTQINGFNQAMDEMIDNAFDNARTISPEKALQHIDALKTDVGGFKLDAVSDLKAIDSAVADFEKMVDGRKHVTVRQMQEFKKDLHKKINWNAKRLQGTPIKESTQKTLTRGAKDSIVEVVPEAADINRALSELYELQPELVRSVARLENRNLMSLGSGLNVGAGAMVGAAAESTGLGVGAALIANTLGNPKTKAALAIAINKLKTGDIGWLQNNIARAEVRVALALAGRLEAANADTSNGQQERQPTTLTP